MSRLHELVARARARLQRARADHAAVDVGVRTFRRFSEDDGGPLAAALTYYTFFSIFPLLLFTAAALGYLTFGNEALRAELIDSGLRTLPFIRDALNPEGLAALEANRNGLAITAVGLALYTGTGAIVALEHALNRIHRVATERTFIQKRLRSLMWLGILGAAAVVSLGFSTVSGFTPGPLAALIALIGGLIVNSMIFSTAYKFLPAKEISWSEVLPGALVAAVGFEVLKVGGGFYLSRGESVRDDTFGTFAAAAALLVGSFLISQMTLLAAEVNAVLAERRATRQSSMVAP